MFDRSYCIISTKCSVTFAKNEALYFVNVCQSTPDCRFFFNIRLPGPRASIDSRWPPSSDSTLMFQKRVLFKTRWSPTSALVQMICKFINKKEICLPLYAIISMQINSNTFFAILQFLTAEICFFLRFYSQLHHKICTNNIALTSVGGGRVVRWCWVNFQCRGVLQFGLQ